MCWVALDRGVKIARMLGKYGDSERWMQEADNIRQDVMEHGWKEKCKVSLRLTITKRWIHLCY